MNQYLKFIFDSELDLGAPEGVGLDEIVNLEKEYNVKLPEAYKAFLLIFGRKSGYFMSGYQMTVDKLKMNKESALYASYDELNDVRVNLKDSYFFFGQWQGYNFYFFDCDQDSQDPSVYLLSDKPEIIRHKESFTDFLKDEGVVPNLK